VSVLSGRSSAGGSRIRRSRRESIYRYDRFHAALFLTPWTIGVLWLIATPIVLAVYWSFTNYDLLTPPRWVGLANYKNLFHDRCSPVRCATRCCSPSSA
jgi:multiple sugar transport system permease protein